MSSDLPLNPRFCFDSISKRQGCTRGSACNLRHDIVKCSCGLVLPISDHASHYQGKRHREVIAGKPLRPRIRSRGRARGFPVMEEARSPEGRTGTRERPSFGMTGASRCPHCSKDFAASELQEHIEAHGTQARLATMLAEAQRDKHGIAVEGLDGVDFGIVDEGEEPQIKLVITRECEQPAPPLLLYKCRMLSSTRKDEHGERFSAAVVGSPWINPGRPRQLTLTFHPSFAGRYEDTLELLFLDQKRKFRFVIHRKISATVGDKDDHEQLQAKGPYVRRKRGIPLKLDGPIKRSLRPATWTPTKWKSALPEYDVPKTLTELLYKRGAKSRKDIFAQVKMRMPSQFDTRTYGSCFQVMLHLEEEQMRQDLDVYAMEGVTLEPNHPRYNLKVEGLAEGRPSVLVGDFILVRQQYATDKTWFQGRVHQVYEKYVSLRFDDTFSTYRGNVFDVRFVLNRLSLRRMHDAITNSNNPARMLFPGPEHAQNMRRVSQNLIDDITPINRRVGEDPEQLETVTAIKNLPPGSAPFIVFGPPGTGKTVTIIEAIRQILADDPDARILACAPSNSAADLITQRLVDLGPSQVLRLNSLTRKLTELPEALRKFSIINGNEVFAMPLVEDLRKYRVVVSTCITAGVPAGLGIKNGFYTHIFVDEAGQAMEPAVMVPLKTLADEKTRVILAGDNKQLGPIVHSALASALGLKTSYLARLMDRPIYSLDKGTPVGGRGVTIVKLVKNFRSHKAILAFSNAQFYNNELQYAANPALTNSLENSSDLPTKKFPLIFHGVVGKDQREESSPSFFNIDEVTLVKKYCSSLVSERKNAIRPEHIAVITPYHAQRIKVLTAFQRDPRLRGIKVGSVEEFQGQERRVVIISTVRSSTEFITADITRTLGFVASPHRFNVAITRAQALLVIIGNPNVLSLDPLWRSFLNYVHRGGGWRGKEIKWDVDPNSQGYDRAMRRQAVDDAEDTIARLKALITRKNEEIEDDFEIDLSDSDDENLFGFGEGRVFREED